MEDKDNMDRTIDPELLQTHHEKINNTIRKIKSLGIPVTKCEEVISNGFIIRLNSFDEINKSLIAEKSICAYNIEIFNNIDFHEIYDKKERYIHTYIRLGETNTWLYIKTVTLFGFLIDMYEKGIEDFDECGTGFDDDENDFNYERINRLSTIVAKSKGFGLLKNRDQRREYSKEVLNNIGEVFDEHELYGIAANAESFYDFGVLPIAVKKLRLDGKSDAEIAKTLGHTKARIEKAMLVEIPDVIRASIEQYNENA